MIKYPQMIISSDKDNHKFIFKDDYHIRWLACPPIKKNKIYNNTYFFEKNTVLKYNIKCFSFTDGPQEMGLALAKRLWESLWTEGWREKKLF